MIFGYIDPGTGFTVTSLGGMLIAFLSGVLGILLLYIKKLFNFFRRNKFWSIIGLIVLVVATLLGVSMNQKSQHSLNHKIVIIGFDALSPRVMEPLMAQGRLKNFARLRAEGGYRHLRTTNPAESPVAWSAFSTGQNPGKNGIFDFIARNPHNYQLSLSLSDTQGGTARPVVKSPRFWQYTSQKNIPTVILGCPVSFPPDKIHGKMLSGMGVPDALGTEGTFSFYTSVKENQSESGGGKVFYVKKSDLIINYFYGPRVAGLNGEAQNVKVPFKLTFPTKQQALIEFQGKRVLLNIGQFSDWQELVFDLGMFRKSHVIFKFLLVETEPELKLYVSPFNLDPRDPFFSISYPKDYGRELAKNIGLFHTQGMPFDTWALNEGRLSEDAFLVQALDILQERERMLSAELKNFDKGVFYFYFEDTDIIQHMFWRYTDPAHPLYQANAPAAYKNAISDWYEKMDAILGAVMNQLGAEDILLVLSDHGFDTYRRTVHLNSWLRDEGYLELKDPGALSGDALLKSIDWSKTRAYAFGFGSIHFNQKGREAQGIVALGMETEQLKTEITQKLEGWMDPKFNKRIVNKVYKSQDIFWGKLAAEGPDLVVGFDIGYGASWQTALGAVPAELIEDNLRKWSGTHLFDSQLVDGVVFSNRPLTKVNPSIMDFAPTILHLSGFTSEEIKALDFDGEPIVK